MNDIADVWFDSGSTHAFVLEQREDLHSPADLYLEGSDQHRGWFHSSLLESCGTRSKAPYKGVLTHGFVLDEQGRKMSKSLGNVIQPQKIIQQSGADILRLWVVSSDYYDDLRIGAEILKRQSDHYRRAALSASERCRCISDIYHSAGCYQQACFLFDPGGPDHYRRAVDPRCGCCARLRRMKVPDLARHHFLPA